MQIGECQECCGEEDVGEEKVAGCCSQAEESHAQARREAGDKVSIFGSGACSEDASGSTCEAKGVTGVLRLQSF